MKSGNLKLLEPSGPVRACNGTALPLPLHLKPDTLHVAVSVNTVYSINISVGTLWY